MVRNISFGPQGPARRRASAKFKRRMDRKARRLGFHNHAHLINVLTLRMQAVV